MTAELFIDVIGGISVNAGLVRIELTARQTADGQPTDRMEVRQRVIMPIQGFLTAFATLSEMAEKLGASAGTVAETAKAPQSPNFR